MRARIAGTMLLATAAAAVSVAGSGFARDRVTHAALQIAYRQEMNARVHYLAFAERAEREGHEGTACLFRAIARAESVHAVGHATAIEQLNGQPRWQPEAVTVGETPDNLRASIVIERREHDVIYPRMADLARAECQYEALASFNYAGGAEETHAKQFAAALERLDRRYPGPPIQVLVVLPLGPAGRGETAPTCYLCLGDGSVFPSPVKRCPNCGTDKSRFVVFACPGPP